VSLSEADPDGIFVLGVPRAGFSWISDGSREIYTLKFYSYDTTSNLLVAPERGGMAFSVTRGGTAVDTVDEVNGVQYLVQRVPAGNYYLTQVDWGPYGRTLLSQGSVGLTIDPGTVSYFGNLVFDTPLLIFQDVTVRLGQRQDGTALSILAKYPNIRLEMQSVVPRLHKLNCDLDDGVEACTVP